MKIKSTINSSINNFIEHFEINRHPMDKAVERNDFDFVKNNLDPKDDHVLFFAVKQGNTQILEYAFPFFSIDSQRKSLNIIASLGRLDYLDFALKFITVDTNDNRPHELACSGGHFEMVKKLESLGMKKSKYSFFNALDSHNLKLIQHVYSGEDITTYFRNQTHSIPLDVLKFIMSHTKLSEANKQKVFLGAAAAGFIDVLEYLMLLPDSVNTEGALFETVYFGNQLPTLKYLLTEAPILSEIDEDEYQAFIWAYDKGYEDFVNYMVNYHYISPNSSPDVFLTMKKDNFSMYNRVIKNKIS